MTWQTSLSSAQLLKLRSGQHIIHIYLDKETGKPKDHDVTVSYEDMLKLL